MKTLLTLLSVAFFVIGCASTQSSKQASSGVLDYGDFTSQTLTTRAWDALNAGRHELAIAYTEKCIELYEEKAKAMQADLIEQRAGRNEKTNEQIHANWALNDVGTSYYIKGEAMMQLGRKEEAIVAYKAVMNQFYFAQTWDPKGWFWAPAEAATPKVTMLSGDF